MIYNTITNSSSQLVVMPIDLERVFLLVLKNLIFIKRFRVEFRRHITYLPTCSAKAKNMPSFTEKLLIEGKKGIFKKDIPSKIFYLEREKKI